MDYVLSWTLDLLDLHLRLENAAGAFSGVAEANPTYCSGLILAETSSQRQSRMLEYVPCPLGGGNPCAARHVGPGLLLLYHPESSAEAESSLGYSTSLGRNRHLGCWGSMDEAFPAQPQKRKLGMTTETSQAPMREREPGDGEWCVQQSWAPKGLISNHGKFLGLILDFNLHGRAWFMMLCK